MDTVTRDVSVAPDAPDSRVARRADRQSREHRDRADQHRPYEHLACGLPGRDLNRGDSSAARVRGRVSGPPLGESLLVQKITR